MPVSDIDDDGLLAPGAVVAAGTATGKKALLQLVATTLATTYGLGARAVVEILTARERLGSTGFGGGIAIPHGRLEGIAHPIACFVRLPQPVEFQAVDDLPVDLIFALLSPPDAGATHLRTLASVSRRLRDPAFVAKLRGAGSNDALYALLSGLDGHDAG